MILVVLILNKYINHWQLMNNSQIVTISDIYTPAHFYALSMYSTQDQSLFIHELSTLHRINAGMLLGI